MKKSIFLILLFAGCTHNVSPEPGAAGAGGNNGASLIFQTKPAPLSACSNGGIEVLGGYSETNGVLVNPTIDFDVCNGAIGAIGATGQNGTDGSNGTNGTNGYSIVFTSVAATLTQCSAGGTVLLLALDTDNNGVLDSGDSNQQAIVTCDGTNGTNGTNGNNGTNGSNGSNGTNGTNGADGTNGYNGVILVVPTATGCPNGGFTLLTATDTLGLGYPAVGDANFESALICNGTNGTNGSDGATGAIGPAGPAGAAPEFTPVIVVNPCGPNSSAYKEALLGLYGGGLFGSFTGNSSALTVRDTLLPDGGYYDTDDSECYFNVSTDGSGDRLVSWSGSTANGSGPWGAGDAVYTASTQAWAETYNAPGN